MSHGVLKVSARLSIATWRARFAPIRIAGLALMTLAWAAASLIPHQDVDLYAHYATVALHAPLFHLLPREYPGASIGLFILPKVLPIPYVISFSIFAEVAVFALLVSSDGLPGRPGWSRRVVVYLALATPAVLVARYDIAPALAAFLAVERARSDRFAKAWAWAVVGALLKLFPALLLPGFLIVERRKTGKWPLRRVAAAGVVFAATAVAQVVRAPGSLLSPFRYELRRGFEVESVASVLSLAARPFHTYWVGGYGGVETVGGAHALIGAAVTAATVVAVLAVIALCWRGRLTLEATSLAVLTAAVLGEKALSPQYLIWIVPLWSYYEIRRGWVVAAGLTTVVYPLLWFEASDLGPSFLVPTAVAGLRDGVLVVATALWLRAELAASRRPSVTAVATVATGPPAPGAQRSRRLSSASST